MSERLAPITRIAVIWLAVSILFVVFLWPDIADRINDRKRKAKVRRIEAAYDQATRIIIDEEIARDCAQYEEDLEREASAILARLDYEYRVAADGRRSA